MVRKTGILLVVLLTALVLFSLYSAYEVPGELNSVARHYAARGAHELGSANLVTAVVVTYRGLDTLGEVMVLFLATAIIGILLKESTPETAMSASGSDPGEILRTGAALMSPLVFLFGVFIFIHGHLSPGGGFQGGAVIAVAFLLGFLSRPESRGSRGLLHMVESLSGLTYLAIGLLGLYVAGGFLDNRILPVGIPGQLFSAGAIPVIYSLIGLKVGAELAGLLSGLRHPRKERGSHHA